MNRGNAVSNAKFKVNSIEWYVPQYTPSLEQPTILSTQMAKKIPTQLQYTERSVFMKEVNTQNYWSFELGSQQGINIPIFNIAGFQQRERQDAKNLNNDTFYRLPVTSSQCVIGTEKYPDNSILLIYDDNDYSQAYGQNKEAFKAVTKDDISNHIYQNMILGPLTMVIILGYNFYVLDIRYPKNFTASQPIKIEFKF